MNERCSPPRFMQGIWRDEVYKKGPNGEDILVKEIGPRHNMITLPFTYLLAALLQNDPSMLGGILYHAIGEGSPTWDTSGTPLPTKFDVKLLAELSRLPPDGITYIKYGYGKAQSGTTTVIVDPDRVESCVVVGRFEPDGFFDGMEVEITAGTNVGEVRIVSNYYQLSGQIEVSVPFPLPIDSTSEYEFHRLSSLTPTNAIEVRTTWDYGNPSDVFNFKYIREEGLFGGTATATADSGFMLDRVTHDRIYKDCTVKLVRFLDIIFRV